MALPLPDQLLNARNKELRDKCDRELAEARRYQAIVRLEKETLRAAEAKTAAAKEKLVHLRRAEATSKAKLEKEEEAFTRVQADLARLKQSSEDSKTLARDLLEKANATALRVDLVRGKVREAEGKGGELESEVLAWIEENRITASATEGATGIFKDRAHEVAELQRITAKHQQDMRKLEAENEQQRSISTGVELDARAARDELRAAETELTALKRRIEDADQHKTAMEAMPDPKEQLNAIKAHIDEKRRVADEARNELRHVEGLGESQQSMVYAEDGKKSRLKMRLISAEEEAKRMANELAQLEKETHLAQAEAHDKARKIENLAQQLDDQNRRRDAAVERLAEMQQQLLEALGDEHAADEVHGSLDRMRAANERDLAAVTEAMAKGIHAIQQAVNQHNEACDETTKVSGSIARLKSLLKSLENEGGGHAGQVARLDDAIADIDEEIAETREKIRAEDGVTREADLVLKAALKAQVQQLKEELHAQEKLALQRRRDVADATAELRRAEDSTKYANDCVAELKGILRETEAEIANLHTEAARGGEARAEDAAKVERLRHELEVAAARVDKVDGAVVDAQVARVHMEAEARAREAALVAETDAARVQLNSEEAERRQLAARLVAARHSVGLLESRYNDRTQALADLVNKEVSSATEAGALVKAQGREGQANAAHDALAVKPTEVGTLEAEELQARCLLARSVERGALQDRGDTLDGQLVQCEKDMRTLDDAIGLMRRDDRGAVIAMSRGLTTRELSAEEAAVDDFIDGVSQRFAVALAAPDPDLVHAVDEATAHVETLKVKLADIRDAHAVAKDELASVRAERDRRAAMLRAAERQLKTLSTAQTSEKMRNERARDVVRVTQQTVLADKLATARLLQQREGQQVERVESALWDVVYRVAAQRPNTCGEAPKHLARLSTAFGLGSAPQPPAFAAHCDPNTPRVGGGNSASRGAASCGPSSAATSRPSTGGTARRTSSSSGRPAPSHGPDGTRRAATAALVAAMSERTAQSIASAAAKQQQRPTSRGLALHSDLPHRPRTGSAAGRRDSSAASHTKGAGIPAGFGIRGVGTGPTKRAS